jgi:hypothetical protein
MNYRRRKFSITGGELTPLTQSRVDFEKFRVGCHTQRNFVTLPQGPVINRPGFEFIADLADVSMDITNWKFKLVPFVFNADQSYMLIFYVGLDGNKYVIIATTDSEGNSGLVTFDDPPITECPPGTSQDYQPGDIVCLTLPAAWNTFYFSYDQIGDELWVAQTGLQPHIIRRHSHTCWEVASITFANQPASWSDTNGWPELVTFHQQRSVFANHKLKPNGLWFSEAGDLTSMSQNSPLQASDAFSQFLNSRDDIEWLDSNQKLSLGTTADEWIVYGSDQVSLTPENPVALRQTTHGSVRIPVINAGQATLFVQQHGRKIFSFNYNLNIDKYRASDQSVIADHLTWYTDIREWAHQAEPSSIIWCRLANGALIGFTFQEEHKINAWHQHPMVNGVIRRIAVKPGNSQDDLWAIIQRTIDGQQKLYLEKMAPLQVVSEPKDCRNLDSFLVYEGPATSTLSGFDHLIGEEISLLVEGAAHPSVIVQADGSITMQAEFTHVVGGLMIDAEIEPYVADIVLPATGSILGTQIRALNVYLEVYQSMGGEIGRHDSDDPSRYEAIPFRRPFHRMDEAIPLQTGTFKLDYMEGWDHENRFSIRQRQPFQMIITGVTEALELAEE